MVLATVENVLIIAFTTSLKWPSFIQSFHCIQELDLGGVVRLFVVVYLLHQHRREKFGLLKSPKVSLTLYVMKRAWFCGCGQVVLIVYYLHHTQIKKEKLGFLKSPKVGLDAAYIASTSLSLKRAWFWGCGQV